MIGALRAAATASELATAGKFAIGTSEWRHNAFVTKPEPQPSARLLDQRIRNRLIEYLELASSYEDQVEYERVAPIAYVPHEVINQWADWSPVDQPRWPNRLTEAYSAEEIEAMQAFHHEWKRVIADTPDPLPPLAETQQLPAWERLREAATTALRVFERRGHLPEDKEV